MDGGIKTVSRAVRVVQKCKKLEFKSIDASVTSVKNGDKVTKIERSVDNCFISATVELMYLFLIFQNTARNDQRKMCRY